ncbi:MAG TPA: glutamine synthetase family protein [Acidimicrobiia bacterium]|jgi:glutamine synthetase|nr:glutamine synthetase family protein [Acidimicrobiia bacterium]
MSATDATPPPDAASLGAWLDAHGVKTVRTEGVSLDGVLIGKHLHRAKFEHSLPLGPALTELAFGYDVGGTPFLAWWDEWRRDALGDIHQRPDLSTLVAPADEPGTANVIVDHVDIDGNVLPVCARGLLRRMVDELAAHGLTGKAAFEIEAMVFDVPLKDARAKHFRDLTPLSTPAPLAYLLHNSHLQRAFREAALARIDALGIEWEAYSDEGSPGQFELNLAPADPVTAADRAMRARQVLRETAIDLGYCVTFMAKPTIDYGNGLHVHHSLTDADGLAVFHTEGGEPSDTMRHWIGGLLATMRGATSILAPTINSYRRLVGWAAAPTTATWAEDNKTTAVRVLTRTESASRIEHRLAAADANVYLVLAAVLAGGLAGLRHALEPPPAFPFAGWGLPESYPHLPTSISKAADALEADSYLREELGAGFVDFWVNTRRWEWLMFHTTGGDASAESVTDWELARYFEIM